MRRRAPLIALLLALLLGGGTVSYVFFTDPDRAGRDSSARDDGTSRDSATGGAAEESGIGSGSGASETADSPEIAAAALAAGGNAAAGDAPAAEAAPAEPDPAYSIGGAVVDANGRDVAGATVELFRHRTDPGAEGAFEELIHGLDALAEEPPVAVGRTDLAGRFLLVAGAPGEYRVGARLAPFAGAVEGPFRLTERDPAVELLIVLGGGLAITGFVEDEAGNGLGGAEVALLDQLEGELPGQHYHAHRTVSAADGSFAFEGVEPRRYIVIAVIEGYSRALVPSVTPPLEGLRIEVGRGRELAVRVLGADRSAGGAAPFGVPLPGSVGGEPVAGAEVYAVNPVGFAVATTDAEGIARLAISGRDVSLRIVADGFHTARAASVDIPEDADATPYEVILAPLDELSGVVVHADGSPAPFAEILEYRSGLLGSGLRTTRADGDGRFTASSREVIAALDGEVSALQLDFVETIPLEPTGTVTGRVLRPDGLPAVGARVRLAMDQSIGGHGESLLRFAGAETSATIGLDGRFLLRGVPAWSMLLVAIECEGSPDRWELAAADLGDITLGEEAVLEGRVVTPEGRAPTAAALVLELPGSAPLRRDPATGALRGGVRVLVAADGTFRIDRLSPGSEPLELHVVAPPYLEVTRAVTLTPGANGPIEITLREGGEALVRVAESSGDPCAAARVELSPTAVGPTRSGRTGPDGVARFPGIAEGSYMVQAIHGAAAGAELVEIRAGEVTEIELTID